jgi:glutaredoxin 3
MATRVVMYATAWCPYCQMAERLLRRKGVEFEMIRVDLEPQRRIEMMERTQRRTVPQIYVDDYHVGGYDDLSELDREGRLDSLLRGKDASP